MNKEKILRILDFLIPIVSVVVVSIAGTYLYRVNKEHNIADEEYAVIEEAAGVTELPESMEIVETNEDEETVDEYKQTFFNIHVNFDALTEINEDVIGWIYIPSIGLSYPVLQGEDNQYYLSHTMEGTLNSSGSIFMDAESDSDMFGFNTFFYGHAMKNGTMFGSLKEFLKHPETIDKNPYIYYFTKDHAYKYRIIATYITHQGSNTYMISETKEQFYNYMQKVSKWNRYENGLAPFELDEDYGNVDWDTLTMEDLEKIDELLSFSNVYALGNGENVEVDRIITLSTCSGNGTGDRKIVQAYLFDEYKIRVE